MKRESSDFLRKSNALSGLCELCLRIAFFSGAIIVLLAPWWFPALVARLVIR
jgi:hypothetical protein